MCGYDTNATQVRKLLRQQAAVARFGRFALRESDVLKVSTEAARACAECLGVPFSKVCRYRAEAGRFRVWHNFYPTHQSRRPQTLPQARHMA
jgi:hypothetical protein